MSLKGARKYDSEEEGIFDFEPHVESSEPISEMLESIPASRTFTPSQSAQKSTFRKPTRPVHEKKLAHSTGFHTEEESDEYFRQNYLQSAPGKSRESKKLRPD